MPQLQAFRAAARSLTADPSSVQPLSVTTPEPLPDGHALYSLDNVILTPHMSGLSLKYYVRAVDLLKVNVARVRAGKGAFNAFHGRGEDD